MWRRPWKIERLAMVTTKFDVQNSIATMILILPRSSMNLLQNLKSLSPNSFIHMQLKIIHHTEFEIVLIGL